MVKDERIKLDWNKLSPAMQQAILPPTIHIIWGDRGALCGFQEGIAPRDWPVNHGWVPVSGARAALQLAPVCKACELEFLNFLED